MVSALVALATLAFTPAAHAGWVFPGSSFGVGPDNNGWGVGGQRWFWGVDAQQRANLGFGPFGQSLGVDPQQGDGMWSSNPPQWGMKPPFAPMWGTNAQQTFGADPFSVYLGVNGPRWFWGMDPQQSFGASWSPLWGFRNPWIGMNPQPTFNPYAVPYYGAYSQQSMGMPLMNPWMGMNPQVMPAQMPQNQQQADALPVQCTINAVAALTKSVNDCEKAGGEIVKKSAASNSSR